MIPDAESRHTLIPRLLVASDAYDEHRRECWTGVKVPGQRCTVTGVQSSVHIVNA